MFQLQLGDTDVTNGTIAVTWCLDQDTLNDLVANNITDPQVVICVAPVEKYHITKEYRKIVSLKDLMTFIEFRAAGVNKIWGFISYKKKKESRDTYLSKKDGEFHTNILNYDGDKYASWLRANETAEANEKEEFKDLSSPISVTVPKGVFAKEPAYWEKIWVNHLFRDKVIDQCDFRRRRFFAYGVQPIILLAILLVKLVIITIAASILCRAFSLKYLYHPLTYSLKDTLDVFERGSLLVFEVPLRLGDKIDGEFPRPLYLIRKFWLALLLPLFWLPIALMIYNHAYAVATIMSFILLGTAIFVLIMSFMANHARILGVPFSWTWNKLNDSLESKEIWYLDQDQIDLITCSENKKTLTYKNMPAHRKTFKLKMQNIKSKVCKPFSL